MEKLYWEMVRMKFLEITFTQYMLLLWCCRSRRSADCTSHYRARKRKFQGRLHSNGCR